MSDWTRIILTALGTISGGVVVYVVGQLIQKLFIEPLIEQRKVIGDVDVGLILWAREWANLSDFKAGRTEQRDQAEKAFREYASRLVASTNAIGRGRIYAAAQRLGAPIPDDIRLAARNLIGLSNQMYSYDDTRHTHERHNQRRVAEIRQQLRLWIHAGEEPIAGQENAK